MQHTRGSLPSVTLSANRRFVDRLCFAMQDYGIECPSTKSVFSLKTGEILTWCDAANHSCHLYCRLSGIRAAVHVNQQLACQLSRLMLMVHNGNQSWCKPPRNCRWISVQPHQQLRHHCFCVFSAPPGITNTIQRLTSSCNSKPCM